MHRKRVRRPLVSALAAAAGLALLAPVASPAAGSPSAAPSAAGGRAACDPFGTPDLRASVPTANEVIGIDLGDRDVTAAESDRYLRAVSASSPRVVDGILARSWNGRPLRYAVVGKPRWVAPEALRRIGRDLNRLRDAATPEDQARRIVRRTPAVLWVAGNVHGGEESGTDAALRVLYELAARKDCAALEILDRAIVVVLPTQNPDGREADTRRNAYDFDLNRDWFARTQPETDGKVAMLRRLPPQLFIDDHEMGSDGFFFPPNADPVYHDIGETPLGWIYKLYGPTLQQAFARFGFDYFNGDLYDLFYMGYGDTVPAAGFNAAGMTYEKNNGEPAEVRVQEQYTAVWATLSAAGRRHSMLKEWRAEHVKAARQGARGTLEPNRLYWEGADIENEVPTRPVRHYFIRSVPGKAAETRRLVARLVDMDVKVYRLTRPLRVPGYKPYGRQRRTVTLPAGTYWVPMAQGQKHWVQAMLNEDTYVPFPYFYDVTAFSGPLLNNVPGGSTGAVLRSPAAVRVGRVSVPQSADAARGSAPRIGVWRISADDTSALESAGWLRWWLDRRLQVVYDDLTAADFTAEGLAGLDVLVVPNGDGEEAVDALGDAGVQALKDWAMAGGHLITLRGSSAFAAAIGMTPAEPAEPTSDIPGSLVRVELDQGSPLARGVGRTAYAMEEYDLVWTSPREEWAPVTFPGVGDPDWFISGFARGAGQLRGTAAVVDSGYGDGRVTAFAFDPNYRAFTDGTQKILRNAIVGPKPKDLLNVDPRAGTRRVDVPSPVADRLVLSVDESAAGKVRSLLRKYDARAETVSAEGRVSFRVDLGGLSAEEHPFARQLAQDVAELGSDVVAVRLP